MRQFFIACTHMFSFFLTITLERLHKTNSQFLFHFLIHVLSTFVLLMSKEKLKRNGLWVALSFLFLHSFLQYKRLANTEK